ncbi:hypothetical protein PQX77_002961 [Marasmius sp. AFHP31]|nr:hypothetical protein PQX77_002961 [Marasmius sp. AFHP31]
MTAVYRSCFGGQNFGSFDIVSPHGQFYPLLFLLNAKLMLDRSSPSQFKDNNLNKHFQPRLTLLSSKVRRSFEGKVGAVFKEHKIFVTSPNQDTVPSPLFGQRSVRLRRDYHFGEEDPIFFPQPFSHLTPHLAVIPYPTSDLSNEHSFAWRVPIPDDFTPVNLNDPVNGLGRLSEPIRSAMKTAVDKVMSRASRLGSSSTSTLNSKDLKRYKDDKFVRTYMFTLKFFVSRTASLASCEETFMSFALCQRAYLELVARLDWYTVFLAHVRDPSPGVKPLQDVVGALAGDDDVCERLYRTGIPVWYVRSLGKKEGLRVDRWIDVPVPSKNVVLRATGLTLSLADASPPHHTVFTGYIHDHERYTAMGAYLREYATTNVFMNQPPSVSSSSLHLTLPSQSTSSTGPSRREKHSKEKRSQPYSSARNKRVIAQPERNKFEDVASPMMPPVIPAWASASAEIGRHFDPNTPPLPGVNPGYALPDPNGFIGTANE